MAFNKRTWKGRQGTGLNKFSIGGATPVTVINQPDSVTEQGDALSAGNLNDLENRIYTAFEEEATARDDADTALKAAVAKNTAEIENLKQTTGQQEITVSYPDDGNYSSLMPNKVPLSVADYAEIPRFRGKSREWNQLVDPNNLKDTVTDPTSGVTVTNNGDGTVTLTGTANASSAFPITKENINTTIGHKYYLPHGDILVYNGYTDEQFWEARYSQYAIFIGVTNGRTYNDTIPITLYDLTLIFGSGNEPSTVADALTALPALGQYNAYNAGSLVSTTVEGVESVGVNIWDEEWELGEFNTLTGETYPANDRIRTKDFIPITPNTAYYLSIPTITGQVQTCWYDKEKNFIGADNPLIVYASVTSPSNAYFVKFSPSTSYGTTYNHDIQICLNSYPDKTTYHPYKSDTLSLSEPVTLKSAGAVAEVLDVQTGKKTRPIRAIDLGSLNYAILAAGYNHYFISTTTLDDINPLTMNALASGYVIASNSSYGDMPNRSIRIEANKYLTIKNEAYDASIPADIASFKASLSGVMMNYELATPLSDEQVCDPVPDNFLEVEGGGTIETIQTQTPVLDNCIDVTYDIIPQ